MKIDTQITLVVKKPYKFKGRDGSLIEGNTFGGYLADGRYVAFSSQYEDYEVYEDQQGKGFNPKVCQDITLYSNFNPFDGTQKWSDQAPRNGKE